jgi:mono/diheme cytochrome c family protein
MRTTISGQAPIAILFWIAGLSLFFVPFLRTPDGMDPEGDDPGRAVSETDIPFVQDARRWEEEFQRPILEPTQAAAEAAFGAGSAAQAEGALLSAARVRAGKVAYETHCIGCHGESGDGAGPAARHLDPRPRNLRKGMFKFTSTATMERPLREDLFGTITRGLSGSSMPDFRLLSEETRWDLVEYVRYLAIRGEFEQLVLDLAWEDEEVPDLGETEDLVLGFWAPDTLRATYPPISEPPADAASVARGKALYFDAATANCAACHGEKGVGDGPSAGDFKDEWGYPIRPRDLTTGVYRAGSDPAALYRSIATGVNGTPMPSFASSMTPEDIWDLVHFVRSLRSGTR